MALAQVRVLFLPSYVPCLPYYFRLEVRLPRTWLCLVEEIAWNYDEETIDTVMGKTIKAALDSATALSRQGESFGLEGSFNFLDTYDAPDTSISPDLLSPIPSRDPSPRRLRPKSKSPARWKILKSINDAIQHVMNTRAPGVYGTLFCPHSMMPLKFLHSSIPERPTSRPFRSSS